MTRGQCQSAGGRNIVAANGSRLAQGDPVGNVAGLAAGNIEHPLAIAAFEPSVLDGALRIGDHPVAQDQLGAPVRECEAQSDRVAIACDRWRRRGLDP
jgi:hypothetical protein